MRLDRQDLHQASSLLFHCSLPFRVPTRRPACTLTPLLPPPTRPCLVCFCSAGTAVSSKPHRSRAASRRSLLVRNHLPASATRNWHHLGTEALCVISLVKLVAANQLPGLHSQTKESLSLLLLLLSLSHRRLIRRIGRRCPVATMIKITRDATSHIPGMRGTACV